MSEDWKDSEYFKEEFAVLKSGEFKGHASTKWHRNNSGWIGIRCPKCGKMIQNYRGGNEELCNCGWEKNKAGFRYRYILMGVK